MPGYGVDPESLEEVVQRLPWGSVPQAVELIIHPATRIEAIFGELTESRLREYDMYRKPSLAESLRRLGVEPVGFEVLR
jgi:hypothetical protein